jgi:hypothetical protein
VTDRVEGCDRQIKDERRLGALVSRSLSESFLEGKGVLVSILEWSKGMGR